MNFKDQLWPYLNERVKFFFDSLRNLGISVGVLIAAEYVDKTINYYFSLKYVGYGLITISIIHFFLGTLIYFQESKNRVRRRRKGRGGPPIQLFLLIIYLQILMVLYLYQLAHGK